jgi:hypothetical protein
MTPLRVLANGMERREPHSLSNSLARSSLFISADYPIDESLKYRGPSPNTNRDNDEHFLSPISIISDDSTEEEVTVSPMTDTSSQSPKSDFGSLFPDAGQERSIDSVRLQLTAAVAQVQRRVSLDTLRPLSEFLGSQKDSTGFRLTSAAFGPADMNFDKGTAQKMRQRIRLNWDYFLSNYCLIAACTALVVALMHPGLLLVLALLYGLWFLHSYLIRHELAVFGIQLHQLLTVQQRFYVLSAVTATVAVLMCLVPLLTVLAASGSIILVHAALRDARQLEAAAAGLDDSETDDLLLKREEP